MAKKARSMWTVRPAKDNKDEIKASISVVDHKPIRIILFGGVDLLIDGDTGNASKIGDYIKTAASNKGITLREEEIKAYNSPWIYPINLTPDPKPAIYTYEDSLIDQIYEPIFAEMNRKKYDEDKGMCIVYGYSLGGQYALGFVKYLQSQNINVDVLYTIDAAKGPGSFAKAIGLPSPEVFKVDTEVPSNVKFNLNIYQTELSMIFSRGLSNEKQDKASNQPMIKNVNVSGLKNTKKQLINHDNIDEFTALFIIQSIIYFLEGNKSIINMSESEIKEAIQNYDSKSSSLFY